MGLVSRPLMLVRDEVTVRPYRGESSHGPVYADPVPLRCQVVPGERLVVTSTGDEVTAQATVLLDAAADCPAESLVQLAADGPWRRAVTVQPRPGAWTPQTRHLEIALT